MAKYLKIEIPGTLLAAAVLLLMVVGIAGNAAATIVGETGTSFNLVARTGNIITSDGDSFLMWGYGLESGTSMQYPGPTLILQEGQTITVTLKNELPAAAGNVSIVFPGQIVTASGGAQGLLTREAVPGSANAVTYTFVAKEPGTYMYHSGTRPDLQVEMGLVGAIIIRPKLGAKYAYNHANTRFDREFLYLLTEMDPRIHRAIAFGQYNLVDTSNYFATNWFINGRNFPDVMQANYVATLPNQPYNCQPRMLPGETVLLRFIGGGRDPHPMHEHGNDFSVLAVDGRMLQSAPGKGADLAWMANTIRVLPGQTVDVTWTWTGAGIGWDIYGHLPGQQLAPGEDPADHAKPFPVVIPPRDELTFGQFYSGSPFLGGMGELPTGHPGFNAYGGFFYMWHSHTEKELTSNDIWPGGLVSFMIVEPPGTPIP
ncbi:multicopper oxidase domain-containing protein [Desulfoferrobacter suflitae]|uniref:multicopper oxidase domain-containing protein n=1 Tax=Desulfoferrobacter suflitae TaxID=2865782 RepID=UPI0021648412|nr:multicopper oxidase domain-containing protein [Desulfoferrobacter suflitae]MCK8600802.1 multicopper oxidase domain-containing protein [Desulfoferrobacter suflitae]